MTSTAYLASKNQKLGALYIPSVLPGIRNLNSLNDFNSLNNLCDLKSLISSKILLSLMFSSTLTPKWPLLVSHFGMAHNKTQYFIDLGTLSVVGCGGHGFYFTKSKGHNSNTHCQ